MKNYSKSVSRRPQTQPMFGQKMVQNNAGGFSFEISPQDLLERFLLIGTEGGTYYVGDDELTVQNAEKIVDHVKKEGSNVVNTVVDFAVNNRAPKADAGLFVLALAMTYGDELTKKQAYNAISSIAKTSTQLFTLLANVQELRGWSRGLRKGVANFYQSRTTEQLAYQLVKYRNRAGFTHKDVLRLSHPKAVSDAMNELFQYAVGKRTEAEVNNPMIQAFGKAQTASTRELVSLIKENGLTWEMVPTEKLNEKEVLEALLEKMPVMALIRNLNRFSYAGLTKTNNNVVQTIVSKLTNEAAIGKSGIHPVFVVNALLTYSSGRGQKGDKVWTPNQNIVDALSDTFELSTKYVESTGKKILVGVDISGSMSHPVNNMAMSASQIANILAVTILKSEKNSELVWFDTEIQNPTLGRRSSLTEILKNSPHGGGTDCAQPIVHAANNLESYDAIIILTDNETWAGPRHGLDVLNSYRRTVNADVKVVEVALVANGVSNMPDNDKNLLRVVGFDSSVTEVINNFLSK